MPSTVVVPSENRVFGAPPVGTRWTQSEGSINDMWDLINNGVSTPEDGKHMVALAPDVDEDFGFDTDGLPNTSNIHTITIQFRYLGLRVGDFPAINFQLWTDYPTTLARMIAEQEINTNTGGALQNGQVTFTGLTVSNDEARSIRCVPITLGNADFPVPDPYIEM